MKYDFSGWGTKNNIRCSDGRTIIKNAFEKNNGQTVPLVWNHRHDEPRNVLGHAFLENREEGVYVYGAFNESEMGQHAKLLVSHGDVVALSIYANKLKQNGGNVVHGDIKEVSLVLAGANPQALIEQVVCHGEESPDEVLIYFTTEGLSLTHSEETPKPTLPAPEPKNDPAPKDTEETVADVFETLTEKQKTVVYALLGQLLDDESEGGDNMKHNLFDKEGLEQDDVLSHTDIEAIVSDAKRYGSLKDSVLAHGITNVDYLFPDAKNVTDTPSIIGRDMTWVSKFMSGVHHTPFSRIKSVHANLTEADARAKGYIKGKMKLEEVFGLLKRSTTPTTVYKKQKMDRDDVVDIVDFDVVAWLKREMRVMLDEEIARAGLVGDGRPSSSDDKVHEANIRPVWTDEDLYSIKCLITVPAAATADQRAKMFIRSAVKSRKEYKGSGNPSLFTTEDILTDCLLMEDTNGRVIYDSVEKLATALRVKEIVTVPVMENLTREVSGKTHTLMGIILNLKDYAIGADKGGAVGMFDDFDIDYNQQKYLIETRCSGALTVPYSAIVIESTPEVPAG